MSLVINEENNPGEQVDSIIAEGITRRASDIHIEPHQGEYRILFRVDGILHEEQRMKTEMGKKIVARVKILGKIPVYIKDTPQDGRFNWNDASNLSHDIRVAVIPTIHGEKVVVRLFHENQDILELDILGFSEDLLNSFKELISKPTGTILLTGPAGCGKTTTIYAALRYIYKLRQQTLHIVTIEDPVECDLGFATQIQVKSQSNLGFAEILRSVLRQDPEVIVVGEIRDKETAQIAISAGLTGHLVISTIHAGRAGGVFTRLLEMGIESYLLSSSISGVLAQRLIRKICLSCSGKGCKSCRETGYFDRTAIGELLVTSPKFQEIIKEKLSTQNLNQMAKEMGMKTIYEDGLQRVKQGISTMDELYRVIEKENMEEEISSNNVTLHEFKRKS